MLLVTGTGRSGTSLFSNTLARAGVHMGPTDTVFGENDEAVRIDGDIARFRGYRTWVQTDEAARRFGDRIRAVKNPALKSTFLCHTLDVWQASRPDLSVVVCHRRVDRSTKSFQTAYPLGQRELEPLGYPESVREIPIECWLGLAFGQLMDVVVSSYLPYRVFRFPDDLAAPVLCWRRLAPVLEDVVSRESFLDALQAETDQSKIHW